MHLCVYFREVDGLIWGGGGLHCQPRYKSSCTSAIPASLPLQSLLTVNMIAGLDRVQAEPAS